MSTDPTESMADAPDPGDDLVDGEQEATESSLEQPVSAPGELPDHDGREERRPLWRRLFAGDGR